MFKYQSYIRPGTLRVAIAAFCLGSLVHCFGGWQEPLGPQGDPRTATTPSPEESPGPSPVDSPSPTPGDGNTLAGNANAAMPGDGNTTTDPNACQPIAEYFTAKMWTPLMSTTCVGCHQDTTNPFHLTAGDPAASLTATEAEAKKTGANNTSLLLLKPSGQVTHGGGMVFSMTSPTYMTFEAFVTAVQANAQCVTPP